MPLVELEHVEFSYPQGPLALRDVSLAIDEGEFVAIAGPNGGGKSTLLRVALGIERPARGRVRRSIEPSEIGYLAQRTRIGVSAPATVREVVEAGRAPLRLFGRLRNEDREAIDEAIERVGLTHVASRPIRRLSGGQQQRAFIAKALAARPRLLVLDEPTTGVDVESQEALATLLGRLHEDLAVTILYVSHEFGAVEHVVQRLVLVRETIVFDGDPAQLPGVWHDPSHTHA